MKRISSIVLLALAVMLTANAQQRKATPASKSSPAAKAISATFAIVNMGESSLEKPLAEGPDCLYLIDQLDRSVISIDKKTGTIKRYIPGGRDKMITAIGHDGKDLYMMVTNVGLVRYDGQSRDTSPCLFATSDYGKGLITHQRAFTGIAFSPNKRWLVAYGSGAILFDMDGGQCKPVREYTSNGIYWAFPQDDGSMIAVTGSEVVAIPNTAAETVKTYHEADGGAKIYKVKGDITSAAVKDGMLYATWSRFVARTPLPWDDIKWEQVYQLESEDNRFRNFAMNNEQMFAECDEYGQYYCEWSSTDFTKAPKITASLTTSVMNPMLKRPYEQQRNGDMLYFDQQGNLIMYCYDKLDIYNPKGIKGYTSLLNKRTRYKAE